MLSSMGSTSKDSSSPGVGGCRQPARHAELEELDSYAGYCVGLGPVLEAVVELPPSGSPIPASAQSRVRQFFAQQLSIDTGTAPRPLRIRPPELQDLKQLHKSLQQHAMTFKYEAHSRSRPWRWQQHSLWQTLCVRWLGSRCFKEKNSPAYGVLLNEGYRAGVMAIGCAGLRAILKLRITTPTQLAQACAVAVQSMSQEPLGAKPAASSPAQIMPSDAGDTLSFAWHHLKAFYCGNDSSSSSSDGPPWKLSRGAVVSV